MSIEKSCGWLAAFSLCGLLVAAVASAQEPVADDELARHLTTVRSQIENKTLDIDRREELALDMAATLDRAAQAIARPCCASAPVVGGHRAARLVLQGKPRPSARAATAVSGGRLALGPGAKLDRAGLARLARSRTASRGRGGARQRDRSVARGGGRREQPDPRRQPPVSPGRGAGRPGRSRAHGRGRPPVARGRGPRACLGQPPETGGLAGYWHLLKADLLRRSKKPAEAEKEVAAAVKSTPAPPAREVVEVNVPLLIELKRYRRRGQVAGESSRLDKPVMALWMVRIRLAQLGGLPAGRRAVHRSSPTCFAGSTSCEPGRRSSGGRRYWTWRGLRLSRTRTSRRKSGMRWPMPTGRRESPRKAGRRDGARRGSGGRARAGRRSGRLIGCAAAASCSRPACISRPIRSYPAPPTTRPPARFAPRRHARAAWRAAAPWPSGLPGASSVSYTAALEQQLRDFPTDPSTNEARWLLGQIAVAAGDRARAEAFWSAIATASPRWLDSRLAIAALDRDALDRQQINPDRHQMMELFERADRFLEDSIRQARSEQATAELLLARARLNLTP